MESNIWMDLLVLERKYFHILSEIFDLTKQLAETVDRHDPVSIRLLLSLRQEPILRLREVKAIWEDMQRELPAELSEQAAKLLRGSPAVSTEEEPLAVQVASNQRLLEKLVALDSRISRKLGGEKSFYASSEASTSSGGTTPTEAHH